MKVVTPIAIKRTDKPDDKMWTEAANATTSEIWRV